MNFKQVLAASAAALMIAVLGTATAHDPKYAGVASKMVPNNRLSNIPCVDGRADVFPCHNLDLLAFIPKSEFGVELSAISGMSETWGWFDPETGDEYVIQGVSNGVHFVRVNDPYHPEYLGVMPNTAGAQLVWYDMKVNDNWLYTVSESAPHNVRAFDLTSLRGTTGNANVFVDAGRYVPNVSAHNIVINDDSDFAYVVGGNVGLFVPDECSGGLIALDLSVPMLPVQAGCWDGDAYVHDSQCVIYNGPDTEHVGKEICLNSNENSFSIVDFSDKTNPRLLGRMTDSLVDYTHQGWVSEDHRTFFLGDEGDETTYRIPTRTMIIDIDNLDDPKLIADYFHETASIDHNMYVNDGLLYQSNYTSGLRVLDTAKAREGTLDLIAWFDTFPDNDNASFAGSWGNYPYLPSGTLAISSGEEGLFLVRMVENPQPLDNGNDGEADVPAAVGRSVTQTAGGGALALGLLIVGVAGFRRRRITLAR